MRERLQTDCARAWLRDATADAHARTDRTFGAFDLGCPDGFSRFLSAQHAGLAAAASELRRLGRHDWADTVESRRDAVAADLADLGRSPDIEVDLRVPEALGLAYVVAGSLHGTSVLRARYQALNGRDSLPRFFGAGEWKPLWRDVLDALGTRGQDEALRVSACATFGVFERAGRLAGPQIPVHCLESVA